MKSFFHIVKIGHNQFSSLSREVLPYNHFFGNGIIGSGTCVLSKSPILDSAYHEFSQNGYPHEFWHGDWFAGKGIGICTINHQVKIDVIIMVIKRMEFSGLRYQRVCIPPPC